MEVGERGANLSAGEAQLVAFARVAAREPKVLILDEATASVDSLTEQKVQRAIETLLRGRSVIVIAHRLSTIRRADRIIVLRQGEIAQIGSHEELMARGGLYAELLAAGLDEPAQAGDPAQPDAATPDELAAKVEIAVQAEAPVSTDEMPSDGGA
jgi:ATP-binding cassette subfamily B protein